MSVNAVNKNTGELVPLAGKPIQDAGNINYTNTTSHLSATKVQGAIDEVASIAKAKFIGTTSDWNNLSTAVKKTYDEVLLTDDYDDILDYITAGNISYDNTGSGLLSDTVQDAITELSTEKQEKTDTSLTTTDKTVPGAINELKRGLTNVGLVEDGTITAQEGVTITSYILKKVNHVVNLQMLVKFTPTIGTYTLLTILPSGFRPFARLMFACVNDTSNKLTEAECDSWGAVRIYPSSDDSSAVSTNYFLTTTFIVA